MYSFHPRCLTYLEYPPWSAKKQAVAETHAHNSPASLLYSSCSHWCSHLWSRGQLGKKCNRPLTPSRSTPFRKRISLGTRLKCLQGKGSKKSEWKKKQKTRHLSIPLSLIYFCFTGNISPRNLQIRQEYMIGYHFKNPDTSMYRLRK